MKKIGLLLIIALITGFALSGCLSFLTSDGLPEITIVNETGYLGYYLYVSPVTSDRWGEDVLGREVLRSGNSFRVRLNQPLSRVNRYDFRLVDLDGDSYEIRNLAISNNSTVVFRFNDMVRR